MNENWKDGYVRVFRSIKKKGWYKKSDYKAVFLDCLIEANHAACEYFFAGENIILLPGQFVTGRKKIAFENGINESKIERILNFLEKSEHQIEQRKCNQNRLITVVNWSEYQGDEQQIEQPVNNEWTTSEQPVNTNKKKKNTKNEKKKDIYRDSILEILAYFKEKTEKEYDIDVDTGPVGHVRARFKDGKTLPQMKAVVDIKTKQWKGDPKWDRVLRLKTLFNKENFQEYYNESQSKTRGSNQKSWHAPTNVGKSKEEVETYERILKQEKEALEAEKLQEVGND